MRMSNFYTLSLLEIRFCNFKFKSLELDTMDIIPTMAERWLEPLGVQQQECGNDRRRVLRTGQLGDMEQVRLDCQWPSDCALILSKHGSEVCRADPSNLRKRVC